MVRFLDAMEWGADQVITGSENGTIRIWVCDDFYSKKPISPI